jgi:cell division protein FtsB
VKTRFVAVGVATVLALGLAVYGAESGVRVWKMKREIERLRADNVTLRARSEALAKTVQRLRTDPAYIEKLAREDLGWVREGDTVLKFPAPPR